jgi:hypothetical protein
LNELYMKVTLFNGKDNMSTHPNQRVDHSANKSVVILGMHRSGTSVMTRVINMLGLPLCDAKDFLSGPDNPTGHWESASLMAINDQLLKLLGGKFDAPPRIEDGWEKYQDIANLYSEAASVFGRVYARSTWVWKDPRTCITLPFWRTIWPDPPVAVFVHREPLEISLSLGRRDGIGKAHCIALWERYARSGLHNAKGLPFVTVRFDEVMAHPVRAIGQLRHHLISLGVSAQGDVHEAAQVVSGEQATSRHLKLRLADDWDATGAQRSLLTIIDSLPRVSSSFDVPDLGEESASTSELLSAIRERHNYHPRFLVVLGEVLPAFRKAVANRVSK